MLQQGYINQVVVFGHPDFSAELSYSFRRVTPAPHSRHGGHTRIIPALHQAFFHQFYEPPFAENCITQTETGEFDLLRTGGGNKSLHDPIERGTVVFELQG